MKAIHCLFIGVFLATSACHPSYQKLLAYDAARSLRDSRILLVLSDHQSEAATFKAYGYARAAARHERIDAKTAERFDEAMQMFDFCSIERVWQSEMDTMQVPADTYLMSVERRMEQQGEQNRENWVLVLHAPDGGRLQSTHFPQEQVIGESLGKSSLSYAFRMLDARMEKLWGMAMADYTGNTDEIGRKPKTKAKESNL